jgi:hypothetical protein
MTARQTDTFEKERRRMLREYGRHQWWCRECGAEFDLARTAITRNARREPACISCLPRTAFHLWLDWICEWARHARCWLQQPVGWQS